MNNFQSWGDPTIFIFRGGIGMLGDRLFITSESSPNLASSMK